MPVGQWVRRVWAGATWRCGPIWTLQVRARGWTFFVGLMPSTWRTPIQMSP